MHLSLSDWSLILDAALTVVAVLFPGLAAYALALKKGKAEILQVLDQVPVHNENILEIAKSGGHKLAAKAIEQLIQNQPS